MNSPVCHFCQTIGFFKFQIEKWNFSVYECPKCGLIYRFPIPEKQELENYYQADYYSGNASFAYEDERKKIKYYTYVWKARIKKLLKAIQTDSEIKKILDIGASFGGLLHTAQKMGFDPYGIEISDFSRNYAQELLGKQKIFKSFEEAQFPSDFFDAVTLIEVIEHLDNPKTMLKTIYDKIKKGGVLLIQTANMDGLQAKKAGPNYHYYLPGHLFYFSKKNLKNYLSEIGFEKIRFFHPVEFGLLPKLLKSRGNFEKITDYRKWFPIIGYHLKSLIYYKDFCLTSSMVVYAWK